MEVPAGAPRYAGLVTRTVAFVIDAAIINVVAFLLVAGASLVLSMFGSSIEDLPDWLVVAVGAGGWLVLAGSYFVGSWALTGQTVGMRVMAIRVLKDGRRARLGLAGPSQAGRLRDRCDTSVRRLLADSGGQPAARPAGSLGGNGRGLRRGDGLVLLGEEHQRCLDALGDVLLAGKVELHEDRVDVLLDSTLREHERVAIAELLFP